MLKRRVEEVEEEEDEDPGRQCNHCQVRLDYPVENICWNEDGESGFRIEGSQRTPVWTRARTVLHAVTRAAAQGTQSPSDFMDGVSVLLESATPPFLPDESARFLKVLRERLPLYLASTP